MKKLLLSLFLSVLILCSIQSPVNAADERFAVCDQCGFCISPTPSAGGAIPFDPAPSNWETCRKCLYPAASTDAGTFETLTIDPTTNEAPTPQPGRHYTMIGCLSTNSDDFTKPGAAGGVTQALLNVIFSISGGIAFLYLIYGAFFVLTSEGDPDRLNQGKRTIWGAVVGLIFVISSVFLVNLIGAGILKIPGFGN